MAPDRPTTVRPYSFERRLVLGSVRAGRRAAPMHGVVALDVTDARRRLEALDPPGSFTAMVVAAVARAAAAHPEVHAYRDWRGRLVEHGYVDAVVMVEARTPEGPVAEARLVRDAERRTVAELSAELRRARRHREGGRPAVRRARSAVAGVPGSVPALYAWLGRTAAGRRRSGTVLVTAVGMFGAGPGFAIPPPGPHSLAVVVGAAGPRPWVCGEDVVVRDVLELTVTLDHRVVDGAPAARFAAHLRSLLEQATVFDDP